MNTRIVKLSSFLILALFVAGCMIRTEVYQNPPAEGIVLDAQSFEPVAGAQVWFEAGEPKTETDPYGRFALPSQYETKYFRMALPGSSFERIPVFADHSGSGSGIAWAHQFLNATQEAETAPLVIYLFSEDRALQPSEHTCDLDREQQAAFNLIDWLTDINQDDRFSEAKAELPDHHTYLGEQLSHQFYFIERACSPNYRIHEDKTDALDYLIPNE